MVPKGKRSSEGNLVQESHWLVPAGAPFARVSLGCMQVHPTHNTTRASGEQKSLPAEERYNNLKLVSILKDGAKFLSQSNYNAQVQNCPI